MIEARNLTHSYGVTRALDDVSLKVEPGGSTALMGASGSGKSTLLHCLAGVLQPDEGSVVLDGHDISALSDNERSRMRLRHFGVVFQFGDLVPELTLLENVMLPLQLLKVRRDEARRRALDLLGALGVASVADSRTGAVSGGQAQRAAVARAMVHGPKVVLADEPTGALDSVSAESVMDALVDLTREHGTTLLVVTHDNLVASHLKTVVTMRDGKIAAPVGTMT